MSPWLAMPLATLIKEEILPETPLERVVEALACFARTLSRLSQEHSIHHRDIKPDNLYRWHGQWVIGDFGLVQWPDAEDLTPLGRFVGARHYLAPELLLDPDKADPGPADVYALAKTLWVIVTRQNFPMPGFITRSIPQLQLRSYASHMKIGFLEALIERATHPDPRERPLMQDVALELEAWLAHPKTSNKNIDVSALRLELAPVFEYHANTKERGDRCAAHGLKIITEIRRELEPFSRAVEQITGLRVRPQNERALSNIPSIHKHFRANGVGYECAGFWVDSPMPIGKGNNPISFLGGVVVQMYQDSTLCVSSAYAIHGAGEYEELWSMSEVVQCESAQEEKVILRTVDGIKNNFDPCIRRFADKLLISR